MCHISLTANSVVNLRANTARPPAEVVALKLNREKLGNNRLGRHRAKGVTSTSSAKGPLGTGAVGPLGMDAPLVAGKVGRKVLRAELHLQINVRRQAVRTIRFGKCNGQAERGIADASVRIVMNPSGHPTHSFAVYFYGDFFPAMSSLYHVVADGFNFRVPVAGGAAVVCQLNLGQVH